jgi:hypothetical protein
MLPRSRSSQSNAGLSALRGRSLAGVVSANRIEASGASSPGLARICLGGKFPGLDDGTKHAASPDQMLS